MSAPPPYVLVFRGHPPTVGWTGAWPPPPRIWIATGRTTGIVAYIDPDDPGVPADEFARLDQVAVVERYERLSYSELPELSHVQRGAEYILEGDHTKLPDIIALQDEATRLLGHDPHQRP